MKIKISNLGAVKEGTIDLTKRINLFCGHNGTGKTYLAYVIYGLLMRNDYVDNNFEIIIINNNSINKYISNDDVTSVKRDIPLYGHMYINYSKVATKNIVEDSLEYNQIKNTNYKNRLIG